MTDHPANDQFHASSFMQGHNAEYLEQMYARYASEPNAVDEAWQAFFAQMSDAEDKIEAMRSAGIVAAESPASPGEAMLEAIGQSC